PFIVGQFPADPDFTNCTATSTTCPVSWALRIIDSSSVYLLGAGLYSWFSDYSQTCVDNDLCVDLAVGLVINNDIWVYNLVTKATRDMVSPAGEIPTYAAANKNEFLSSLLAWVRKSKDIIGSREFPGFTMWSADVEALSSLPSACKTSLSQKVKCDPWAKMFLKDTYRGSLNNDTLIDSICDGTCGASLKSWFGSVQTNCIGYNISGSAPTKYGGQIWSGWNETCLKDPATGDYCNGERLSMTLYFRDDEAYHMTPRRDQWF
ncbi:unnamed protein product, partial [Penicillium nalgiovense]